MRALIVGQAPSRATDGQPPFSGRSGERLARLLGVTPAELGDVAELVNLVERWPGKRGRGDAFPIVEARDMATALTKFSQHERFVLCGGQVARSFGLDLIPLVAARHANRTVMLVPHPSGLNRWWNDEEHERATSAALRSFVLGGLRAVG